MKFRIRELRDKKRMTQEELAAKSGISRATLWALETNAGKVTTTNTLEGIANALNVSVKDLFLEETD